MLDYELDVRRQGPIRDALPRDSTFRL